jgi:hypothetical protein
MNGEDWVICSQKASRLYKQDTRPDSNISLGPFGVSSNDRIPIYQTLHEKRGPKPPGEYLVSQSTKCTLEQLIARQAAQIFGRHAVGVSATVADASTRAFLALEECAVDGVNLV